MRTSLCLLPLVVAAACGGDDSAPIDAPSAVVRVQCGGATIAATVSAPATTFAFEPAATTITAGQIVQFTMGSTHTTVSDTNAFTGAAGSSTCYRFDVAGTYPFHCEPHLFTGSITVQ